MRHIIIILILLGILSLYTIISPTTEIVPFSYSSGDSSIDSSIDDNDKMNFIINIDGKMFNITCPLNRISVITDDINMSNDHDMVYSGIIILIGMIIFHYYTMYMDNEE